MIFSVSNDSIEWSLDFGPDSVTLTVKDLVQGKTKFPKKILWQRGLCCCLKDKCSGTTN